MVNSLPTHLSALAKPCTFKKSEKPLQQRLENGGLFQHLPMLHDVCTLPPGRMAAALQLAEPGEEKAALPIPVGISHLEAQMPAYDSY